MQVSEYWCIAFKNLCTVPNLLILSSCIADVLNQVFNIPGFAAGCIFKDEKYFVGRRLALAVATFNTFFVLVNLMAMTLMMVDRLCALKFGIAYQVWRTKTQGLYGDSCQMDLVFDDIPGSSDSNLGYRPRKHRYFQVSRCLFLQEGHSHYIYNIPVLYSQQCCSGDDDMLCD